MQKYVTIILVAFVSACASTTPLPITEYVPEQNDGQFLASYEIVNSATPMANRRRPSAYNETQPILFDLQPTYFQVIEDDLSRFLDANLAEDENGVMVRATIRDGGIHFLRNPVEVLPFVSFATVARDRQFLATVEIFFEVEQNGRVINSYPFEYTAEVRGSSATTELMAEAVAEAIAEIRSEGFSSIRTEFLGRYLD